MNYSIENQIGDKGGFGAVYSCTSEFGTKYAIKVLEKDDISSIERFKREIRLIRRLSHPNIISIIDYNFDDNNPQKYYIMPLYSSSLYAILPELYGKYDRQYSIISEILNGVIYLHSQGVFHRDLKPQNILYNSDSDIVINDFGLGRQVYSESTRLTKFTVGFGTHRYTAPEQFVDARDANEKSDIYSLGKIIEDIVTGNLSNKIPRKDLEYIIRKCTNDSPDERFDSAILLKEAIDSIYRRVLKQEKNDEIDNLLSELQLRKADNNLIHTLATQLISSSDNDKVEDYFRNISNSQYEYLEDTDDQLAEVLIIRLQEYFTSQAWGFGYTDIIGDNCKRLYNLSKNIKVRANLLFTIIEVGISHNRWHVMDIAASLLNDAADNYLECIELANVLSIKNTYLKALKIEKEKLPGCLQPYYQRIYQEESLL